jgi:Na+-translocating ferredoxin:NAD+ oxidoreductase RnfC subunit
MLKTFRIGGIHPKENKISAGKSIQEIEIPEQVIIPLSQHIGAPCQPIVKKGDKVKVGTQIGKSVGYVSANIHSPVSGTTTPIAFCNFIAFAAAIGSAVSLLTCASRIATVRQIKKSERNIFLKVDFNLAIFHYLPESFR